MNNRKNKRVFVVRIGFLAFERILQAEDAFDEQEDADDDRDYLFDEAILNNKEAASDAERDGADEFWHFLHVAVLDAQVGDEIIGGEHEEGGTDNN